QDHLRHDVVEVSRAERAGKSHLRPGVVADVHEVDVAFAVDLSAGGEEAVDAALPAAAEQLAPAAGGEAWAPAAQSRAVAARAAPLARQQRRRRGYRR